MKMFQNVIGQSHIKTSLEFFADGAKQGGAVPPILFTGSRGLGKTMIAREFGKSLGRPYLEINCGTIKNADSFFNQIFMPVIMGNDIVIAFDEAHMLPKDLQEIFLTVFNTEKQTRKTLEWKESSLEFDFAKQTFLFCTTDQNKIRPALKDRFTEIDFKPYSLNELGQILTNKLDNISFDAGILEEIIETLRGNARAAVKRAKEIDLYCTTRDVKVFGAKEWKELCNVLGIDPTGLTNAELQILRLLKKRGACTLTTLSAATDIPRATLQQDVERYLLRKGLISIDGKRSITGAGELALSKAP